MEKTIETVAQAIFESRYPFSWDVCSKRVEPENLALEANGCRRDAIAALRAVNFFEMQDAFEQVCEALELAKNSGIFEGLVRANINSALAAAAPYRKLMGGE